MRLLMRDYLFSVLIMQRDSEALKFERMLNDVHYSRVCCWGTFQRSG